MWVDKDRDGGTVRTAAVRLLNVYPENTEDAEIKRFKNNAGYKRKGRARCRQEVAAAAGQKSSWSSREDGDFLALVMQAQLYHRSAMQLFGSTL